MTDSLSQATKSTIMVVDDEPDLVDLLRLMLEQKGFNVMCAYSGLQALADLEKQKPDLILLDIIMCIFRAMPAGYSRACRPPIPV